MSFEQLGLQAELLQAVTQQGYTTPTPIQAKAIPIILAGRDILGGAQTGTGKTAAFALPILQLLGGRTAKGRQPRALILTPTRELAAQVAESVRTYGRGMRLRSTVIFGGVGFQPQIDALRRGVDILVATPGRLLDHINQKNADLSHVEILVLDEADRMLDMGFIHDIRKVLNQLPAERQSMLFSATYSDEVKELADGFMRSPELVEVGHRNTAVETVTQVMHPVARSSKRDLLTHLIKEGDWRQVLVFSRTKHGADRLAKTLEADGISATSIHGNKSQPARTKALADFKNGRVRILVATDIAARGLDIDGLPHVVNYELPNVPEDYIHRIGRTGRAGANGEAVSLVCADEMKLLDMIQRLTRREVEVVEIEGFKQEASVSPQSAQPARNQSARSGRTGSASPRTQSERRPSSGAPAGGQRRRPETSGGRPQRTETRTKSDFASSSRSSESGNARREERPDRGTDRGGDRGGARTEERRTERGGERREERGSRPWRSDSGRKPGAPNGESRFGARDSQKPRSHGNAGFKPRLVAVADAPQSAPRSFENEPREEQKSERKPFWKRWGRSQDAAE
ncbi:MAG TPA: DEAD/DEAH box helicase [Candidatus Sumerlaeota bacterium]|nr:DEAD/DEAH box helicase [Candidatus Sumerlaeota bacterium]